LNVISNDKNNTACRRKLRSVEIKVCKNVVTPLNCIAVYVLANRTVLQCMYCLTQLYDGTDMHRIYYIKNSYMFRNFILTIFRLRN